jgi:hypothetical protein
MFVVSCEPFPREDEAGIDESSIMQSEAQSCLIVVEIETKKLILKQVELVKTADPIEDMIRMSCGLILGNTISKVVLLEEFERNIGHGGGAAVVRLKFEQDIHSTICSIDCYEDYILVGDPYKLVNIYLYNMSSNKLVLISRDTRNCMLCCSALLD